ncbi:DUF305 domain-containing protein [bacterium]|nr:DUF305 domain-containing protein [bacterium]
MDKQQSNFKHYGRFFAMIATSIVVMYFLTYLNSYQILEHARFSETRVFMALIMGAAMMVIMLGYMLGMYRNRAINLAIFAGAALLFALALWLVRSQTTVTGVDYMEAMIPHHSIAILTSERAGIQDPRVRELADQIIESQRREISEMEWLIADIEANGLATTQEEADARAIPDFSRTAE